MPSNKENKPNKRKMIIYFVLTLNVKFSCIFKNVHRFKISVKNLRRHIQNIGTHTHTHIYIYIYIYI